MAYGKISAKQREILEVIKTEILNKGYPPTVRELCDACNLKSTSSVHSHLETLEKNGYIVRNGSKEDSRKKILLLTDKSKDVIMILKKNFDNVAHKVIDDISEEEYNSFKAILDKIERNVNKLC